MGLFFNLVNPRGNGLLGGESLDHSLDNVLSVRT